MKKIFAIGFISVIIVACSAKTLAPGNEKLARMQQKVPGITLEQANAGSKLYSAKCGRCHRLYPPEKYTETQWDKILPKMVLKAKLADNEQQKLVADYVHAMSK